jgi:hypothetical protein
MLVFIYLSMPKPYYRILVTNYETVHNYLLIRKLPAPQNLTFSLVIAEVRNQNLYSCAVTKLTSQKGVTTVLQWSEASPIWRTRKKFWIWLLRMLFKSLHVIHWGIYRNPWCTINFLITSSLNNIHAWKHNEELAFDHYTRSFFLKFTLKKISM